MHSPLFSPTHPYSASTAQETRKCMPHCSHCDTHTHSYVGKHTLVCSCTHREMLSSLRDSQRAAKKDRLLWEPGGICHSTDLNRHIYYVQEIKQQKKKIWFFILMRDHTPLIGSPTLIWTFFFFPLFLILYPRIDDFSVKYKPQAFCQALAKF